MNHDHTKMTGPGLPVAIVKAVTEAQFAANGYGAGMGAAVPDSNSSITPMNTAKAKYAKFCTVRMEVHNSLGMCDWMYPFLFSPLKERGYRGDLTLEAQLYTALTGDTKNMTQLDKEGERFYTLQRCLTIKRYNTLDMRNVHDYLPPWALSTSNPAVTPYTPGNYLITPDDWQTSLDMFYDTWGYDRATGAPKQSTMAALGMSDVAAGLAAMGLTLPA
jgi:aldehyde:ferredoxin oxidoreductase